MAYKLIVADSSSSVQKAIQMAFSNSDYEIYPFEDGLEVMKSLSQINPDAILLSLSLPHKDGYEVGRYLRNQEQFKQTSLVFLKGAFDPIDTERIAGLDYDEIVHEPFDSERLAQLVRDIIEGKKDPQTLPEEHLLDEIPLTQHNSEPKKNESHNSTFSTDILHTEEESYASFSPKLKEEIEGKIRELVKQETVDVERELEKRVSKRVLSELKEWLRQELEDIKRQLKNGT